MVELNGKKNYEVSLRTDVEIKVNISLLFYKNVKEI